MVRACLHEPISPFGHASEILYAPIKIQSPKNVHLFVIGFYERLPIVPRFPLEWIEYHSNMPHFHYNPCTNGD